MVRAWGRGRGNKGRGDRAWDKGRHKGKGGRRSRPLETAHKTRTMPALPRRRLHGNCVSAAAAAAAVAAAAVDLGRSVSQ